jgi:hypothetical protein
MPDAELVVSEVVALETLEQRITRLGEALLARIVSFVSTAAVAVVDVPSLEQAAALRKAIGALDHEAEAFFEPEKQRYYALHRAACAREKVVRAPLAQLDAKVATAIRLFNDAQTRLRQEQERALVEQARKDAEQRAAEEAAALEASDPALAAAVLEEALAAPVPVVTLPNVTAGLVTFTRRYLWRYRGGPNEVGHTPPAVVARTLSLLPREFCCVDERKLSTYARAMKGGAKLPGIEFYHVDDPRR